MRDLLKKHGDFKPVEIQLKKWKQTEHETNLGGRWCTKFYLENHCFYTKPMIENSFSHAKAKGLWRRNPVHGEEEAKLVLDDTFNKKNTHGEREEQSGSGHVEDWGISIEFGSCSKPCKNNSYAVFNYFFTS